ncbi:Hypothetical predicted protein [Xyrichtys novacula]|uniref:Uncharacterized protein n=1 Tax=Xyrichtys novacula TaxID=13765 RepID=A0AAV1FCR3_XYRNO|nr:Hypothetical predicted protein [Xyrichtys novacula]
MRLKIVCVLSQPVVEIAHRQMSTHGFTVHLAFWRCRPGGIGFWPIFHQTAVTGEIIASTQGRCESLLKDTLWTESSINYRIQDIYKRRGDLKDGVDFNLIEEAESGVERVTHRGEKFIILLKRKPMAFTVAMATGLSLAVRPMISTVTTEQDKGGC